MRGTFLVLHLELLRPLKILILYFIKRYVFLLLYLNLECIFKLPIVFFAIGVIFEKCTTVIPLLDALDVFVRDFFSLYALLEAGKVDVGFGLLVEVLVGHIDLKEDLVFGADFMFLSRVVVDTYFPRCTAMLFCQS